MNVTIETRDPYNITLYSLGSLICIFNFSLNIILIGVIIKKKCYKKQIYVTLLSWLAADLLQGLLLFLHLITANLDWIANNKPYLCLFWNGMLFFPLWVSFAHAVICAVDRFFIVPYSNKYENHLSWFRVKIYIGLSWAYAVMWTFFASNWKSKGANYRLCTLTYANTIFACLFVLLHELPTSVISVYLYIKVYMHFHRHERQVHVTHTLTHDELVSNTNLAKLLFYVTALTILTWIPFSIVVLGRVDDNSNDSSWYDALPFTYLIGNVSALFKPVFFFIIYADFRAEAKSFIGIKKKELRIGSSLEIS